MLKLFAGAALAALVCVGAASAAPVAAYGRLPAMDDVEISQNGANVAYIVNDGGMSYVVVQSVDGAPIQTINMGQRKVRDVSWADDGLVLVQVSSTTLIPGVTIVGEFFQAMVLNIKTGQLMQLPNGSAQRVLNVMWDSPIGGTWEGKPVIWGGLYAKEAWADEDGHYDLYRFDPETGTARLHQMGDKDTNGYQFTRDGKVLARDKYRSRDGRWSMDRRQAGSWAETLVETAPIDRPRMMGLSEDGKSLIVSNWDEENQSWRMAPVSLADGKKGETFGPLKPFGVIQDQDQKMIGVTYTDIYREYEFSEPRMKAIWPQVRQVFAGRQVSLSSFTTDYAKLIVFASGTGEPGGYYLVDLGAKKVKRIGGAYPGLTGADIAQVQAIKYKAADGLEINAYLTLPTGKPAKDLPLIVLPHGGPQSRDTADFDWWSQALASRGYAVLQPNFRGSSGYGWAFTKAGHGEMGGKMQTDVSDGVRALAKSGRIDPKRVCIVGASYGGYAALAGITIDKGVYRCAVSVAGLSDLAKMLNRDTIEQGSESSSVRYWERFMGVEKASDPKLAKISPVNFADQADGPVLLIHGKDDTVVRFDQSTDMLRALEKAKKPVEFVTLKAEDHWLSREATRQQMLEAVVTFVEKNNPPN